MAELSELVEAPNNWTVEVDNYALLVGLAYKPLDPDLPAAVVDGRLSYLLPSDPGFEKWAFVRHAPFWSLPEPQNPQASVNVF